MGPDRLTDSHEGYNDAVQLTASREVLKNIVRKRYVDPIQFIAVSTINAQFSVSAGANVATGQAGGNVGYSESPTITFVPQSDASFNKSIDAPIELQEALTFVGRSGDFHPHEVGFVIAAVNDAADRPGLRGDHYQKRLAALSRLAARGATFQHVREYYPRHAPIRASDVGGRAYVEAAKANLYFYDAGDGRLNLASKHFGIGMHVPRPHTEAVVTDLRILGLEPGRRLYPMRSPADADPEADGLTANTIWLAPRSVEGMIELAAGTVDVPAEHTASGLAPPDGTARYSSIELPMRIRHSAAQPGARYRISHRGYWFFVDDTDIETKRLFTTIVEAYTGRVGSRGATDDAPQIVLPLSGG